ncbi:hypothetical protein BU23DRAFT_460680 [Bimuria novae-zelandiae CBS 107.79]|uniref:Uncharacterized protein n=1 Tax=Bimuria novae-zelandiae CBS 107.79 TaxID=1447943 RepID=A0A6A5VDL7_9PLEO|nr:hypothetical protein BU23DRAFT_460680 [Bimuria novae-zelandiae CBS 107.79]
MFRPLSAAYSSELRQQQYRSLGLLPVKKADFFPLFWSAYISSFTEKNILSSFEATGIWPMDRSVVTKKFQPSTPPQESRDTASSHLSPSDWQRMERLLKDTVKKGTDETVKKLEASFHRASTQTKLLQHQNKGLLASLDTKNKRKKNGRSLPLKGKQKREKREKDKVAKEKEKAAEARRKADEKADRDRQKALQTSQAGKRKASRPLPRQQKRQKQVGGRAASSVAPSAAPPPPSHVTRLGRNTKLPAKFR